MENEVKGSKMQKFMALLFVCWIIFFCMLEFTRITLQRHSTLIVLSILCLIAISICGIAIWKSDRGRIMTVFAILLLLWSAGSYIAFTLKSVSFNKKYLVDKTWKGYLYAELMDKADDKSWKIKLRGIAGNYYGIYYSTYEQELEQIWQVSKRMIDGKEVLDADIMEESFTSMTLIDLHIAANRVNPRPNKLTSRIEISIETLFLNTKDPSRLSKRQTLTNKWNMDGFIKE